jgi:hypothetical protein
MEDDSTNSTAVQAYTPDGGGWDSPLDDDASGRQIEGALLRFDNKQWSTGKEKTPIGDGKGLVALSIRAGWKRWENGKPVEFVSEIDGHYPKRHELGYDDESKWEPGPDDRPTDPWQNSREVLLIDPHTCAVYTFCTASAGGRSAVDDLKNAVRNARRLRPGVVPLISLESQAMPTRYGMKSKPYLKVVDWSIPGAEVTALAPPDDLNDTIPDLSK